MIDFGITKIPNTRHCSVPGCKKNATHSIGNTKNYYQLKNLFLCDEHLEMLYTELSKKYAQAMKDTLDERNIDDDINSRLVIKDYLNALYDSNGTMSKAKMIEICQKYGVEIPEETPNMKTLMEMLFKDEFKH